MRFYLLVVNCLFISAIIVLLSISDFVIFAALVAIVLVFTVIAVVAIVITVVIIIITVVDVIMGLDWCSDRICCSRSISSE